MHRADVFLGRQPIVDRRHRTVAHELLFRSVADRAAASLSDNALATAHVVSLAFRKVGIRTVVGRSLAFVNVDAEMLLSRIVATLPPERVVFELLETVGVDERLVHRCEVLKRLGYRLALDDVSHRNAGLERLLPLADIVKVDIHRPDSASLSTLVSELRLHPARLLAEKVETRERAHECMKLGFDFFQGFFFGDPVTLST
jgi:EAL and modified HD-GYP domain-containing signal transduction protein